MNAEAKSLKDWRELRGIDQDDLADTLALVTGKSVSGLDIARWEEVGFPVREGIEADRFGIEVIGPLTDILNAHEGIVSQSAPIEADPGSYVLNPGALAKSDEDVLKFLHEHAEELGLRVAIPNNYDVSLKPFEDLSPEDCEAMMEAKDAEIRHAREWVSRAEKMLALMQEHSADPDAKVGDVMEQQGGRWVPKRRDE